MLARRLTLAAMLTASMSAACAHRGPELALTGSGHNVIGEEELDAAGSASVYDVILRNHALFLKNRGATSINSRSVPRAVVFLGEVELGEIEAMRNQPASRFTMVRYFNGTQATAKFGSQYSGGVIQLIPKYQ